MQNKWRPPRGAPAPGVETLWLPAKGGELAWVPKKMGVDVEEREVWGIDAYTRRNIELALADAEPAALRMAPDEVRRFLESELLPALNRVELERGHDITCALAALVQEYEARKNDAGDLGSRARPTRREVEGLKRRLAGVRAVQRAIVEWEGLAPRTAGEETKTRMFCVHPKGCGVMCKAPGGIEAGDFISEFAGELYPSWLWMQKEECEELQRLDECVCAFRRRLLCLCPLPLFFRAHLLTHSHTHTRARTPPHRYKRLLRLRDERLARVKAHRRRKRTRDPRRTSKVAEAAAAGVAPPPAIDSEIAPAPSDREAAAAATAPVAVASEIAAAPSDIASAKEGGGAADDGTLTLPANIAGVILPDFWNIRLERPAQPAHLGGYDVMYIDASKAGSFCSRMSHRCVRLPASCVCTPPAMPPPSHALRPARPLLPSRAAAIQTAPRASPSSTVATRSRCARCATSSQARS